MALSRVRTWVAGDVLTAADLSAEFDNILNNAQSLIQPWSGTFDLDGNTLILDQDADTSINAATDDTIAITISGADDFQLTANLLTLLSGTALTMANGNFTITAGNLQLSDGVAAVTKQSTHTSTTLAPLTVTATTTNTPAAGIGTGILFQSESADEAPCEVAQVAGALSDVTAGSEDSYLDVLLRTGGAALSRAFSFIRSSGSSIGVFSHAATGTRTWTMPDASGTVIVHSQADVATGDLKTATGSATVSDSQSGGASGATATNATLQDYCFFPSITYDETETVADYIGVGTWDPQADVADPGNTTGRVRLIATSTGDGASSAGSVVVTLRYRYFTASDMPEMWVIADPATGRIIATSACDDPHPGGAPGITMKGYSPIRLTATDLERFSVLSAKASDAQDYIQDNKLRMEHQAYRALQLYTNDLAPSKWLLENCQVNTFTGRIELIPDKP